MPMRNVTAVVFDRSLSTNLVPIGSCMCQGCTADKVCAITIHLQGSNWTIRFCKKHADEMLKEVDAAFKRAKQKL